MNKEKLKNRLSDFFFSNRFVRLVRIFIHQKLKPLLLKILAGIIALTVLSLIIIRIANPTYLTNIYQKSSFYFQRFVNLDYQEYAQINVSGNQRTSREAIIKIAKKVQASSRRHKVKDAYQPLIQKMTFEIQKQLPWVEKVDITRSIPNIITIQVAEYQPFALWYHEKKKYVTDKKGNIILIEDAAEFSDLIIVSGAQANTHVNSLFNIFTINSRLGSEVYSATWSGGRRWDIRLDNGLLIKLPESNISDAWDDLIKIYNLPGSIIGLNVIDLRISGKVYLEYSDTVIREIKRL